jgi:hypothetical protein
MEIKQTQETAGTWLQGKTTPTTRRKLSSVFGDPTQYEEGEKVTIEWGIRFEDGTIATIYDWKRYEEGTPQLDEEISYNVGGFVPEALARVEEALKEGGKAKRRWHK